MRSPIIVFMLATGLLMARLSVGGKFTKDDQPKSIDLGGKEEFAHSNHGNSIDSADDCPFSATDRHDEDYDWQIIELPHEDPQFDHVDHLPMINFHTWPFQTMLRKNKYLPAKKQHYTNTYNNDDDEGWKKAKRLTFDGRKLFLEKKFHYKSKLTPPINSYKQRQRQQQQYDAKKTARNENQAQEQLPVVTMFANHKTVNKFDNPDQINELNQQQQLDVEFEKDHEPIAVVLTDNPRAKSTLDMIELNYAGNRNIQQPGSESGQPVSQVSRAGESVKAAAEQAKQLEMEPKRDNNNSSNYENSVELLNLTSSSMSPEDNNSLAAGWDVETTRAASNSTSETMAHNNMQPEDAKFLGLGQVFKTDNARSTTQQARLSCSFGLGQNSDQDTLTNNVTISNVQWIRFIGNYDPDLVEPPFECKFRTCRMIEVKNDIWTTVHPRPAVQQYLGGQAEMMPSYSVTIHQVDHERHIGVYRCSAIRQIGDKKELVYRVVPFT